MHSIRKVLLLDGVDPVCEAILKEANLEVKTSAKMSKEELLREIKDYDCVVVRSATKITEEVLDHTTKLTVVARAGAGVDNIDVEAATKRGILVINAPTGNTISATEHTCALICALSRSIPKACASLKAGKWERSAFMGNELMGKTLAIIGLGKIGKEVAKRMQSFGMTTIGYDPIVSAEEASKIGIESMTLTQLWPLADYITVHTPLISATRHLINDDAFTQCKDGVRIVNVARGGIVDEAALLRALESGKCAGAAVDVFVKEPPGDFVLCQHPNVICTPHLGANTYEAQSRVAAEIAEQLIHLISGGPILGAVNAPTLTQAGGDVARLWMKLGTALGQMAYQLVSHGQGAVNLRLKLPGNVSNLHNCITTAATVGAMKEATPYTNVNIINVSTLAQKNGIEAKTEVCELTKDIFELTIFRGTLSHVLTGGIIANNIACFSIDGCSWAQPLLLQHHLVLFRSSLPTPWANLASHLSRADIVMSSTSCGNKMWHVAVMQQLLEFNEVGGVEMMAKVTIGP